MGRRGLVPDEVAGERPGAMAQRPQLGGVPDQLQLRRLCLDQRATGRRPARCRARGPVGVDRSPITAPMYSSSIRMSTASIGSSSRTPPTLARLAQRDRARRSGTPCRWSRRCAPCRRTASPGCRPRGSRPQPLLELGTHPFLDAGDELPRHGAADHLVDELESAAGSERLDLMSQTAYWP